MRAQSSGVVVDMATYQASEAFELVAASTHIVHGGHHAAIKGGAV